MSQVTSAGVKVISRRLRPQGMHLTPHMQDMRLVLDSSKVIEEFPMPPPEIPHKPESLVSMLEHIAGGDSAAEAAFCEFLLPGLRVIAQRCANSQQGEDITHNAVVTVLETIRARKLRSPDAVVALARGVVIRMCRSRLKQIGRSRAEATLDDLSRLPHQQPTPEESAVARQRSLLARRILQELTRQQREVLRRFYLDEQCPEQICRDMRLTETHFRLLKARAKARFGELGRQQLSRKPPETTLHLVGPSPRCA